MSDGPLFKGIRQYGNGPNRLNEEPEPSFESPTLNLEGMARAMQPEVQRIEQRLTTIAGMMLSRLMRCANAYCTQEKPELATAAKRIEEAIDDNASPEMDRVHLLAEYALAHQEEILRFKDAVRATRNNEPSTKLDDTLQRIGALRASLERAA
jgi:hypothetical protein